MTTTSQTAHDPVCHMDIAPMSAAGSSEYEGKTYYFCAMGCKRDFDEDPVGVLEAEAEFDHTAAVSHEMGDIKALEPRKPWWKFWA